MLLVIEVGKVAVSVGVFNEGDSLATSFHLSTEVGRSSFEYGVQFVSVLGTCGIGPQDVKEVVLWSEVPALTQTFKELSDFYFGMRPFVLSRAAKIDDSTFCDPFLDVGLNRIAKLLAGMEVFKPPVLVVDVGTDTVFDAVSEDRVYLGGAISPGIGSFVKSLSSLQGQGVDLVAPGSVMGLSNIHSLQSGLVYGFSSLIVGMVELFRLEIGRSEKRGVPVVGTGSWADFTHYQTGGSIFQAIDPDLTVDGLRMIYRLNQGA